MAKKTRERLNRIFRGMVYALPGVVFFSYWPVISLGSNESMNFELSLPLIWLVLFDLLTVIMLVQRRKFWKGISKQWPWLLLPAWLTVSVLWSLNPLRGVLTVGILWLLYLAGYGIYSLRGLFEEVGAREKFWKFFFGATLVACGWCWLQCILDLAGVPREYSLMCAGCTYEMFGFPHPNGWAIEPQFMGNLLLAPLLAAAYFAFRNKKYLWLVLVIAAAIFLTFSRGAIYAGIAGLVVMTIWQGVRQKTWRVLQVWGVIAGAFVCVLGAQGIMAASSPTNDTFQGGVAKVLNQLTLGVVDVREKSESVPVEDVVEIAEPDEATTDEVGGEEAAFDGYVAESTDTRLRLSGAAVEVWRQDFATAMFGVGLGGAGQALYVNGLSPAPKEIVQNQYASLLLESGLVGVLLVVVSLALVARSVWRSSWRVMLMSLILAYMISLCFFSGLPNALHIYLLPFVVTAVEVVHKKWRHV